MALWVLYLRGGVKKPEPLIPALTPSWHHAPARSCGRERCLDWPNPVRATPHCRWAVIVACSRILKNLHEMITLIRLGDEARRRPRSCSQPQSLVLLFSFWASALIVVGLVPHGKLTAAAFPCESLRQRVPLLSSRNFFPPSTRKSTGHVLGVTTGDLLSFWHCSQSRLTELTSLASHTPIWFWKRPSIQEGRAQPQVLRSEEGKKKKKRATPGN